MLLDYAKKEFEILKNNMKEVDPKLLDQIVLLEKCIIEIIEILEKPEYKEIPENFILEFLKRLMLYMPLTELTGEDDEWVEIGDNLFQNKRCRTVFKENEECYDSEGIYFYDEKNDTYYTSKNSRIKIDFPYIVPTEPRVLPSKYDI